MSTALVHYWLVKYRGGERLLELFSDLYPDAPLYTLVHSKGMIGPQLGRHEIRPSFIQKLPFAQSKYQSYLPLMPLAVESFDLDDFRPGHLERIGAGERGDHPARDMPYLLL